MELPNRKPIRLKNYDYSTPGIYFITICTNHKEKIFGNISEGDVFSSPQMVLSQIGQIANEELLQIEQHYQNVKIDKYTIMPNHVHLLVRITERINPFPTMIESDIPNIIGKYKASVTRNVGKAFMPSEKIKIWQTSYHDHIIRNQQEYLEIWEYIDTNPIRWKDDCFYTGS